MTNLQEEIKGVTFRAYARKSSEQEERQALSISSQTEWIQKSIQDCGIALDENEDILTETKSAKKSYTRPVFGQLVEDIEKGKVQGIIAWHPDRLSRNAGDAGRLIDLFDEGKIKLIITNTQTFRNTPSDKFFFGMLCSQAKMENDNKGENVKRGLNKKAQMGYPPHMAKIGFLDDPAGQKGFKEWTVDPLRFPLIKRLLELYLTGRYSVPKLWFVARNELKLATIQRKREGGKLISRSQMYTILQDPVYAGFFYHGGTQHKLNEKLSRAITEDQYWTIQQMLGNKGKPKPQKYAGLYNYFMRDVNGGSVTADHKQQLICSECKKKFAYLNKKSCPQCNMQIRRMNSPVYLHYIYYQSLAERKTPGIKALSVEEKKIDGILANYFERNLAISKELSAWCIKHVGEIADKELEDATERLKSHEERIKTLEQQLDRLLDIRLARSNISPEEADMFSRKEEKIKAELAALKIQKGQKSDDWLPKKEKQFNLAREIVSIFEGNNRNDKKEALATLGANLTLDGRKVGIYNAKSIEAFIAGLNAAKEENPEFEPTKTLADKDKTEVFASVCPTLLRG